MLKHIIGISALILLLSNLSFSQSVPQQILLQDTTTAPTIIDGTQKADSLFIRVSQPSDSGYVQVPEPSEKAMRFYRSGNYLYILNLIMSFLIPGLILFSGFSAKIRDLAVKTGRKWFFIIGIYFIIYSVILFIIYFPLSYYIGFVRLHDYGLSNQTFGKWYLDSLKSLAVSIGAGFLLLWIPYLLLKKSPKNWWLYISICSAPFYILVMLIVPVWIDPLYNDFGPMQDQVLEQKILDTASRAGIEDSRVFEVNKSIDTEAVNAYVTGIGKTKRIVLWDTIIEKLDEDELLIVMGHEMGHYVLDHITWGIIIGSAGTFLMFFLIFRSTGFLLKKYKDKFGFEHLHDIASLPLFLILINFYSFLGQPFAYGISRYFERQCDTFTLELRRDNRAGAEAFVKLQHENLTNPRPGIIYRIFRATHPPIGERIDFFNTYRPWETGEPLKYEHLFR
ncbi:M48 family metallopeptidase [candidate division KSB1 bacterium]